MRTKTARRATPLTGSRRRIRRRVGRRVRRREIPRLGSSSRPSHVFLDHGFGYLGTRERLPVRRRRRGPIVSDPLSPDVSVVPVSEYFAGEEVELHAISKSPPKKRKKHEKPSEPKCQKNPSPSLSAAPESSLVLRILFPLRMLFVWLFPVLCRGVRKILDLDDLPDIDPDLRPSTHYGTFVRVFEDEVMWGRPRGKTKKKKKKEKTKRRKGDCCDWRLWCCGCCSPWSVVVGIVRCCGSCRCCGLRLASSLYRLFWLDFLLGAALQLLSIAAFLSSPFLLSSFLPYLLPPLDPTTRASLDRTSRILPPHLRPTEAKLGDFYRPSEENSGIHVWLFLLALICTQFIGVVFNEFDVHLASRAGMKMRSVVTSAIFAKSLRMSPGARSRVPSGKILNLIATDAWYVDWFHHYANRGWGGILTLGVGIYLLGTVLGWLPTLISLSVPIVTVPVMGGLSMWFYCARKKYRVFTDKRLQILNELLRNVSVVKLFAWEDAHMARVFKVRSSEVTIVRRMVNAFAVMNCLLACSPMVMMFAAFFGHIVVYGREMEVVRVFAAMAYFAVLKGPIVYVPNAIANIFSALLSMRRIEGVLLEEEVKKVRSIDAKKTPPGSVSLRGTFEWEVADNEKPEESKSEDDAPLQRLSLISFRASPGSLTFVVGPVGSGKSSLLLAMMGEMNCVRGRVAVSGKTAFCEQNPWLQSTTLRDNVLFGRSFDAGRYERILDCLGLHEDIRGFQGGDRILLGDDGMNLSGGQQYRVALARSCYTEADVYLLDSPFSAVDAPTGRRIFENCICGELQNTTRVVVTHQIAFCERPEVDLILMMKEGRIVERGSFRELMGTEDGEFAAFARSQLRQEERIADDEPEEEGDEDDVDGGKKAERPAMEEEEEERPTGLVKCSVIMGYVNSWGGCKVLVLLIVVYLATQLLFAFNQWYLSNFSSRSYFHEVHGKGFKTHFYVNSTTATSHYYNHSEPCPSALCLTAMVDLYWEGGYSNGSVVQAGLTTTESLIVYLCVGFLVVAFTLGQGLCLFNILLCGNNKLFRAATKAVLGARMQFFDRTPNGRIVSRFSMDVSRLDIDVLYSFDSVLSGSFLLLGAIGLISYTSYGLFLPIVAVLFVVYAVLGHLYRKSYRELNRLLSIQRSPLTAQLTESLSGALTVRTFGASSRFLRKHQELTDVLNRCQYLLSSSLRWLQIYLTLVGCGAVFAAGGLAIIIAHYLDWPTPYSFLALAVTTAMGFSDLFALLSHNTVDFEARLNTIERIHYYATTIEQEESDPPTKVPRQHLAVTNGEIRFEAVSARYQPQLPRVLTDVSFRVMPRERIGIVGRTGAGKSTVLLCLFRILEPETGCVRIDGRKIADVSIASLRDHLSIIPQDPILFEGTVRSNLDPRSERSDEELWRSLEKAHFASRVREMGGLEAVVKEKAENWSMGEKQLLCLARAIVRGTKIMAFDEATANIDVRTDKLLQKTIRKELSHCTILTVAHRLTTVIDCDRILVMKAGQVVEFDRPSVLLENPDSEFSRLVAESPNSATLRYVAQHRESAAERFGWGEDDQL